MGLHAEATSLASLRRAFERCHTQNGGPGSDGVTVGQFAARIELELARLNDELTRNAWRPLPARQVKIPKAGGGHRTLAIGCVRDRVVQHSLAETLSGALDPALHRFAFAWRKGRSTQQALEAVDLAMLEGREWVFRGDIEEFFDRIPPAMVLGALESVAPEPELLSVVSALLHAGTLVGGQIHDPLTGTGQGSPLSPFLANLYLTPFDRAVEAAGMEMVRYGDDVLIASLTRAQAESARQTVEIALGRLRLQLNPHKVEIRHRGEGFGFLGFGFDPNGRRPGSKARRALGQKLEETLQARAESSNAGEIDALLRGWMTYYGTLAGVDLPEAVRPRAEALMASRSEAVQFGALDSPRAHSASPAPSEVFREVGREVRNKSVEAPTLNPWQEAAMQLQGARGTRDEGDVRESLRQRFAIEKSVWNELCDALVRFDGVAVAEVLARLERFGDAEAAGQIERPTVSVGDAPVRRGLPVVPEDSVEVPRFSPQPGDAERLLELFGGAEHTFLRDIKVGERVERQRVAVSPATEHLRAHLNGDYWLGVYPLRGNNSVRFAAIRVVVAARARVSPEFDRITEAVTDDARKLGAALRAMGLSPIHSEEPGRARVVWVLFATAVTAARARTVLELALRRAGPADATLTRELVPMQETAKPDKPGTGVLLPLGLDPKRGERALFCDDSMARVLDPCAWLRAVEPNADAAVLAAVGVKNRLPPMAPKPGFSPSQPPSQKLPAGGPAAAPSMDPVAAETSPFRELPRAQEVYQGCSVVRFFVDQCLTGKGLVVSDRMLVAEVLGRLGDEAHPSLEALLRYLDDYRPGLASRYLQRLYPNPTSCGRIRQRMPELTARVGCDCRFRVPPGAYPTPVLHALGAAEVPGLEDRVKEAAARGGLARAAVASMNEGRKELGVKAAALCARLSDLRRQSRVLERTIAQVESELDGVLEEAGESVLETPSGMLKRVRENGVRRFVLEV